MFFLSYFYGKFDHRPFEEHFFGCFITISAMYPEIDDQSVNAVVELEIGGKTEV